MYLVDRYLEKATSVRHNPKITKNVLEAIYDQYWKTKREENGRSFIRLFWEKADKDDNDIMAIFRKRNTTKMRLRINPRIVKEQY